MNLATDSLRGQCAGSAYAGAVAEDQAERDHHSLIADITNAIEQNVTDNQMAIWL
jgi:hypothetical protein